MLQIGPHFFAFGHQQKTFLRDKCFQEGVGQAYFIIQIFLHTLLHKRKNVETFNQIIKTRKVRCEEKKWVSVIIVVVVNQGQFLQDCLFLFPNAIANSKKCCISCISCCLNNSIQQFTQNTSLTLCVCYPGMLGTVERVFQSFFIGSLHRLQG